MTKKNFWRALLSVAVPTILLATALSLVSTTAQITLAVVTMTVVALGSLRSSLPKMAYAVLAVVVTLLSLAILSLMMLADNSLGSNILNEYLLPLGLMYLMTLATVQLFICHKECNSAPEKRVYRTSICFSSGIALVLFSEMLKMVFAEEAWLVGTADVVAYISYAAIATSLATFSTFFWKLASDLKSLLGKIGLRLFSFGFVAFSVGFVVSLVQNTIAPLTELALAPGCALAVFAASLLIFMIWVMSVKIKSDD